MPVYYVVDYYLDYDKTGEFIALMKSEKGRKLIEGIEKETGAEYGGTYFPVMGFGDYSAEDWWKLPNYAAFDKFRESKAWHHALQILNEFYDSSKQYRARLMGSIKDVKVIGMPNKKRK